MSVVTPEKPATPNGKPEMGIRCRRCHCRDWRVYYTRHHDDSIRRVRICRNCGEKMPTREVPLGA